MTVHIAQPRCGMDKCTKPVHARGVCAKHYNDWYRNQAAGSLARPDGITSAQVCRDTGLTYRQLDYWVRCGMVAPSVAKGEGSGVPRRWSEDDVERVRVAAALTWYGMLPGAVAALSERERKRLLAAFQSVLGPAEPQTWTGPMRDGMARQVGLS